MDTHQFENVPYAQLQHGDRVKIAQTYHGNLTGWWWPILTVDHIDWIRDDHTALMLYLTHPLPCGDRFVLITGQTMVDAGVRRVIDTPNPPTNPGTRTTTQGAPMTTRTFTATQLDNWHLPEPDSIWEGQTPDILHTEVVDMGDHTCTKTLIFRAPDDGKCYRVRYEMALADGNYTDPWFDESTVEGVEVELRPVTVMTWQPVDSSGTP